MKYWSKQTIKKIRRGYYTAVYFNRAKDILLAENNFKKVTMQVFQRYSGSILGGVKEVVELLKVGTGYWDLSAPKLRRARWIDKFDTLRVEALRDGDSLSFREPVMHISGPYAYFAHLESLYLGILARRTLVATKVRKAVQAAGGRPIIFFADRFDHFLNQEGDGYAAHIGGAKGVCTEAHASWWGAEPVGTIPHSLIAVNIGNTVKATKQFWQYFGKKAKVITLVDFDNDCVKTSLEVARALGGRLWGVRLDTAGDIVDKSLQEAKNRQQTIKKEKDKGLFGVNPHLVSKVRQALDKEGFTRVKIVVSGGFNAEKIKLFEKEKVPVDVYGVGSSLIHGENDFTADIVKVEGRKMAKVGREYKRNLRFKVYSGE